MGIDPAGEQPHRKAAKSSAYGQLLQARIEELKSRIGNGGLRECLARGLIYVGMARGGRMNGPGGASAAQGGGGRQASADLAEFKTLIREQYFMLLIDQAATLAAIRAFCRPIRRPDAEPSSCSAMS